MPNSTNTDDGVHPKVPAAQAMADAWYAAMIARGIP
jgi:lysophospholipase L1-like esterase